MVRMMEWLYCFVSALMHAHVCSFYHTTSNLSILAYLSVASLYAFHFRFLNNDEDSRSACSEFWLSSHRCVQLRSLFGFQDSCRTILFFLAVLI